DSSVVIVGAIDDAERFAGLQSGDAGELPSGEKRLGLARGVPENRQVIDVADGQDMALIKGRTGPAGGDVIRIDEAAVVAIRGVIDRVAVGVCEGEFESADVASPADLQRVVVRVGEQIDA